MRCALASLLLTLACGCSAAEVLDTTHSAAVIATPAAVAYLVNPVAGILVLVASATTEMLIPDGTEEHIREARQDVVAQLEDPNSTEPLPARLQRLKDELDTSGLALKQITDLVDKAIIAAALIAAAIVGFQLYHYWKGSLVSRKKQ